MCECVKSVQGPRAAQQLAQQPSETRAAVATGCLAGQAVSMVQKGKHGQRSRLAPWLARARLQLHACLAAAAARPLPVVRRSHACCPLCISLVVRPCAHQLLHSPARGAAGQGRGACVGRQQACKGRGHPALCASPLAQFVSAALPPAPALPPCTLAPSPPVRLGLLMGLQCRRGDEVARAGDAKVLAVCRQVLVKLHPAWTLGGRDSRSQRPRGTAARARSCCTEQVLQAEPVAAAAAAAATHLSEVPRGPILPSCTPSALRTSSQTFGEVGNGAQAPVRATTCMGSGGAASMQAAAQFNTLGWTCLVDMPRPELAPCRLLGNFGLAAGGAGLAALAAGHGCWLT